jgi:hypothetical protein
VSFSLLFVSFLIQCLVINWLARYPVTSIKRGCLFWIPDQLWNPNLSWRHESPILKLCFLCLLFHVHFFRNLFCTTWPCLTTSSFFIEALESKSKQPEIMVHLLYTTQSWYSSGYQCCGTLIHLHHRAGF